MKIRLANHADSPAIRQVFLSAFTPFKDGYTPDAFAHTVVEESTIRHRMDIGKTWVGEEDGELVGAFDGCVVGPAVGVFEDCFKSLWPRGFCVSG